MTHPGQQGAKHSVEMVDAKDMHGKAFDAEISFWFVCACTRAIRVCDCWTTADRGLMPAPFFLN
jgi:hypothetical protein